MCFSATASIGTSVILGVIGVVTIIKTKKTSHLPLAVIPLFFAFQQFSEGLVWISLENSEQEWGPLPVYIFLFFAQVLWPAWIPFTIYMMNKNERKKNLLIPLLFLGMVLSSYLMFAMLNFGIGAEIRNHHIHYILDFPKNLGWLTATIYLVCTIFPLFLSTIPGINLLGMAAFLSFILSKMYFGENLISVWCFFAAILSILVFGIIYRLDKNPVKMENSSL